MRKIFALALAFALSALPAKAEIVSSGNGSGSGGGGGINTINGNGSGGTLANVLGTVSLTDDVPTFSTITTDCTDFPTTCQNTVIQKDLIAAREKAFTLKAAANDNVMLRNCVEYYYPRMQAQVSASLVVPALVCWKADGYVRRSGTAGTPSTVCDTTFGSNSLANRECPAVIFPPMAHNIGHLDIYASTTGTSGDGGSGVYFGKVWVPSAATNVVQGTGYTVNFAPTIALASSTGSTLLGVSSTAYTAVNQVITDTTTSVIPSNTQVSSFVLDTSTHSLTTNASSAAGQAHVNFASGGTACSTGELITDTTNAVIPAGTLTTTIASTVIGLNQTITGGGVQVGDTIVCYPTITINAALTGSTVVSDTLNMSDVLLLPQPDASPYSTTQIQVTSVGGSGNITGSSVFNSHYGTYSLPLPLQEYEYTTANGWTGATGTVATNQGRGNVFDPSNAGYYMTSGGTGSGAEYTLTYVVDFGGSGADYNTVAGTITTGQVGYLGANTIFGQVSVEQSGVVSDATYGHTFGVAFNGLQFVGDTVQETGGWYGIWPGGSDDFFFTEMNSIDSEIGLKLGSGGGGFRGYVTIDSPIAAFIVGDNYNDVNITGAFLQKNPSLYTGSFDIILGEGSTSSSTAQNVGWILNIDMDQVGTSSGIPAMQIANTSGSMFNFNINNYQKNGSVSTTALVTSYATVDGTSVSKNTYLGAINDTASAVFNYTNSATLDSGSAIRVWDAKVGAWDLAPGYTQTISCNGTGWTNTGIATGSTPATSEVNNLSVAFPILHANDAVRFTSLWLRTGTAADSLSEIARMCSGACGCTNKTLCDAGSSIGTTASGTITASATRIISGTIYNQNATNAQIMFPVTSIGNVTTSATQTPNTIQTNTGGFINFDSYTITSSADTDTLQSYCVEVLRNPW